MTKAILDDKTNSLEKIGCDFHNVSMKILNLANFGILYFDFVNELLNVLLDFTGCDKIEMQIKQNEDSYKFKIKKDGQYSITTEKINSLNFSVELERAKSEAIYVTDLLKKLVYFGKIAESSNGYLKNGGLHFNNADDVVEFTAKAEGNAEEKIALKFSDKTGSHLIIPIAAFNVRLGVLHFSSATPGYFKDYERIFYGRLSETLGIAFKQREAQSLLRERVKEITCMFGIAKLVVDPETPTKDVLTEITALATPAFLYPEKATCRITIDDKEYFSRNYRAGDYTLEADIEIGNKKKGTIEVSYTGDIPNINDKPFLDDEKKLLNAIANEISLFIGRKQSKKDKSILQEQLRHADRLATIGQLAAGVAHELNEPLGSILGFAQLSKKEPNMPGQVAKDIDKIISASLHAREVVKKLMVFARQMPPKKVKVNLNELIDGGMFLLNSRIKSSDITLKFNFDANLPPVTLDPAQFNQVLINLVVNSVQAMPNGGALKLSTVNKGKFVSFIVEDTGIGIPKKALDKIFIPFFTTKELNEGTGLGLPVVMGIVSSHGGNISVESKEGKGSKFEVSLPVDA